MLISMDFRNLTLQDLLGTSAICHSDAHAGFPDVDITDWLDYTLEICAEDRAPLNEALKELTINFYDELKSVKDQLSIDAQEFLATTIDFLKSAALHIYDLYQQAFLATGLPKEIEIALPYRSAGMPEITAQAYVIT